MRAKAWIAASLAAGFTTLLAAPPAAAQTIYGLINASPPHELIRFEAADPATTTSIGPIAGLQPGEKLTGIDARPATGQLYGLGDTERL